MKIYDDLVLIAYVTESIVYLKWM